MSKVRQKPNGVYICNERARIIAPDWDAKCESQLLTGEGFRITEEGKTDKNPEPGMYSIHSPLFGTEWGDDKAFEDRWSCKCGRYIGTYLAEKKFKCPKCKTVVSYVGVNMKKTGWIILDRNKIIQPHMYKKLEVFIGKKVLEDILLYKSEYEKNEKPLSPFSRIGMIDFYERFDEIMKYFLDKNKKFDLYIFIMSQKSVVFAKSIPVYNALMRHFTIKDGKIKYTKDDILFKRIFTNHQLLNNDFALARKMEGAKKRKGGVERLRKENILYRIQKDILALWDFSFEAIDGKTGVINGQIVAGRMDYTARNVIVPDPTLEMDQVDIGYITALEIMKLEFIDFAVKMYDINHREAANIWRDATMTYSPRVHKILSHINTMKPIILSTFRNPSINYGSRFVAKVRNIVGDIDDHCLSLCPQVLTKPNADFDGDIMNEVFHKIDNLGEEFYKRLNPKSNFMISRNDVLFDNDSNLFKDQGVILYAFLNM